MKKTFFINAKATSKITCKRVIGEEEIQGSQAWHEWRKKFRTTSNASTVFGLNPFESMIEMKKRSLNLIPKVEQTSAMGLGLNQEDHVRKKAEKYFKTEFNAQCWEFGKYGASLDGIDIEGKVVVELKVSHFTYQKLLKNQIPLNYKIQVMQQLLCSGAEVGYIVAMNPKTNKIAVSKAIHIEDDFYQNLENTWNNYDNLNIDQIMENEVL